MNKKILLVAFAAVPLLANSFVVSAEAADVNAPAPSWTGFHAGIGAGYGMVDHQLDASLGEDIFSLNLSGIGGQGSLASFEIGYDYQISDQYLLGLQADYTSSSIATTVDAVVDDAQNSYDLTASDTVNLLVRGGRIIDGSSFLYSLAGYTRSNFEGELTGLAGDSSYDFNLDGFTFGGDIESAIAENVTLKLEYRMTMYFNMDDFDFSNVDLPDGAPEGLDFSGAGIEDTSNVQTIRAVISYHGGQVAPWTDQIEEGLWTGFHVGLGAGYGMINRELSASSDLLGADAAATFSGLGGEGSIGTIELGADYQLGERFVVGVTGDYTIGAIDSSIDASFAGQFSADIGVKTEDSFSILGRAGTLSSPNVLWYGLAGWTRQNFKRELFATLGDDTLVDEHSTFSGDGLTLGVGVEAMIADNFSVKTEYRYTSFDNIGGFAEGDAVGLETTTNMQSVRSVLSYRF